MTFSNSINTTQKTGISEYHYGSVPVLILSGDYKEMGRQYGRVLQAQLSNELGILKQYYTGKGVTYESMVKQGNLFYNRFPVRYQDFLQGEAQGATLSLDEVKILNAMETMGELLPHAQDVKCAFLFIPPIDTKADADIGFGSNDNAVSVISKNDVIHLEKNSKQKIAKQLLKIIADQYKVYSIKE